MKRAQLVISLTLATWILGVQPAWGEGWSLGRLWPFGQNGIQPVKAVKKVGSGTKRAFYKTKQTLSFKRDDSPPSQFSAWRGQQEYRRAESKDDEEPGFFSSLFRPADPPRPSKTIKDFMSQKRVEP
ncbi:MAG: hypothetical protein HY000_18380 [Planctomycetes bacterium]|nr:hypothetical protein [Planctomycetota bacterium]